ncbi:hypothetical protein L210DRAFT_3640380 [Boletus edulis BED1]|uniref:F-box domain-containing protein n=1 Tax=Boletus edulis BED1 TaxID=1328754 RepID=A0AAD4C431_BOLED|nr:hypothetical protein L210DRAFT_3640380 [Boletus edulis BED1]
MLMIPCIAPAELTGYERAEKGSSKLVPVTLQYTEAQSLAENTPTLDATSHRSRSLTSQASITLNGLPNGPISALLEELLIMIFDDVITSESSLCQYRRTYTGGWLSSPRNLASVSRAWRTIVFTCPKLWRLVHLTPFQSIRALKEQLLCSSPISIHLTVHQWPFRNPIPASEPFSIVTLTAQLRSIVSPPDNGGTSPAPASQRVESVTINATERGAFLNFVLQAWTGRESKFPALRHVAMNGNVCATWSRGCFFDEKNSPGLERLELSNVLIAHNGYRPPWGIGSNLTTLVWTAPVHRHGSLVVSVSCFHHVVSSFPRLTTLELHEHVVALEFATMECLGESGVTPLTHIRDLRISGRVFPNSRAAYTLFHLLPSLRHVVVRGRACSGPLELRTVTLALQGLINLPQVLGWPIVLPNLEDLELECVEDACAEWREWCMRELELWKENNRDGMRIRLQ